MRFIFPPVFQPGLLGCFAVDDTHTMSSTAHHLHSGKPSFPRESRWWMAPSNRKVIGSNRDEGEVPRPVPDLGFNVFVEMMQQQERIHLIDVPDGKAFTVSCPGATSSARAISCTVLSWVIVCQRRAATECSGRNEEAEDERRRSDMESLFRIPPAFVLLTTLSPPEPCHHRSIW